MVHDQPVSTLPVPIVPAANPYRRVAAAQGAYFVLTGLWPLFGINSLQAVTGAKTDLWLVYTVGALVVVIGAALLLAAYRGRTTPEMIIVAVGSAIALAGIDVAFVFRGVISWVYLLDAAVKIGLIAWWTMSWMGPSRTSAAPQFAHLERLLRRGRSVGPSANEPGAPIG